MPCTETAPEKRPIVIDPLPYRYLVWDLARARMMRNRQADVHEIAAAGMVGLVEAARTFDPKRDGGGGFMTHARWKILGAISRYMESEYRNKGWGLREVEEGRRWKHVVKVRREADVKPGPASSETPIAAKMVHDPEPEEPIDIVARANDVLTPRQRQVIDGLYLRDLTVTEVAAELGIKTCRVSAIRYRALEVLRERVRLPVG